VDRADLLVDVPGDLDLAVRVAEREPLVQSCALPVGEVLNTGEQGAADPVERVVLVPTTSERGLLDTASDLVECVAASLTTWKASSTATASGSSSRIALRYPRNGSSAAYSTDPVTSTPCSLSQSA
jgi:hypothetical protein